MATTLASTFPAGFLSGRANLATLIMHDNNYTVLPADAFVGLAKLVQLFACCVHLTLD